MYDHTFPVFAVTKSGINLASSIMRVSLVIAMAKEILFEQMTIIFFIGGFFRYLRVNMLTLLPLRVVKSKIEVILNMLVGSQNAPQSESV